MRISLSSNLGRGTASSRTSEAFDKVNIHPSKRRKPILLHRDANLPSEVDPGPDQITTDVSKHQGK